MKYFQSKNDPRGHFDLSVIIEHSNTAASKGNCRVRLDYNEGIHLEYACSKQLNTFSIFHKDKLIRHHTEMISRCFLHAANCFFAAARSSRTRL